MAFLFALWAWLWWLKQSQAPVAEWVGTTLALASFFLLWLMGERPKGMDEAPAQKRSFFDPQVLLPFLGGIAFTALLGIPWGLGGLFIAIGALLNAPAILRGGSTFLALAFVATFSPSWWATLDTFWSPAPFIAILGQLAGLPVGVHEGRFLWRGEFVIAEPITARMAFLPLWLLFITAVAVWTWKGIGHQREWLKNFALTALVTLALSFLAALVVLTVGAVLNTSEPFISAWVRFPVALCYAVATSAIMPSGRFLFLGGRCFPSRLPENLSPWGQRWYLASLKVIALAIFFVALFAPDFGERKPGRVAFDEFHSDWEPVGVRYDTTDWGHGTSYTFNRLAEFLGVFYHVKVLKRPITPEALRELDVLILKIPTTPYTPEEVKAIVEWVQRGGGLWLIGDHTNVFGSATALNMVARRFGILFRDDALYPAFHSLGLSHWLECPRPFAFWHPILAGSPHLTLYTSCSLFALPGKQTVLFGAHLARTRADYARKNFFAEFQRERWNIIGDYLLCVTKTFGKGRVVALSESTFFSNFSLPEPGTWELALYTVEWLNRKNTPHRKGILLVFSGLVLVSSWFLARRSRENLWGSAFVPALSIAVAVTNALNAFAVMPPKQFPLTRKVFFLATDESERRLFISKSPHDPAEGMFHSFFVLPQRVGLLPRLVGLNALTDEAAEAKAWAVLLTPFVRLSITEAKRILGWVAKGGRLLWLIESRGWQRPRPSPAIEVAIKAALPTIPFFRSLTLHRDHDSPKEHRAKEALQRDGAYRILTEYLGVWAAVEKGRDKGVIKDEGGKRRVVVLFACPLEGDAFVRGKGEKRVLMRFESGETAIMEVRWGKGVIILFAAARTFAQEGLGEELQPLEASQIRRRLLALWLLGNEDLLFDIPKKDTPQWDGGKRRSEDLAGKDLEEACPHCQH